MKKILISKCLLGENVRYDGGNCLLRSDQIARLKSKYNIIAVCPEVMAGMGIPRDPIEISNGKIVDKNGNDYSSEFVKVCDDIKKLVASENISLALLKEFSPSCGSSKIYDGSFSGKIIFGEGIITKALKETGVIVYSEKQIDELLNLI